MKKMKNLVCLFLLATATSVSVNAQDVKSGNVPASVKSALLKKYPAAKNATWEKEKKNFEANWGGKSGEENSVQFTPSGKFIEIVKAILVSELPKPVSAYVKQHYKGEKIAEAGKVTDAEGKIFYEAEVDRKDIIFDENGNFVKAEH
jgi:FKBP-type peptidyl-prolyl cis-trans isomerase